MSASMRLLAPAKINLSLDVLGRREDGYHNLEMVLQTIGLFDSIKLEKRTDALIKIFSPNLQLPPGSENLASRSAMALKQAAGDDKLGANITIFKGIPLAAGLGGGSADAAAVLKGLNLLWELHFSPARLAGIGLSLGADIPYCLAGGTALVRGIGEIVTPLPPPPLLWVVLVKPGTGIATAEVFNNFRPVAASLRPSAHGLIAALKKGDLSILSSVMGNVLESVTFTRLPVLQVLKSRAIEKGALVAQMTGSGSALFALASDYRRARTIYEDLKGQVEFARITTFWGRDPT